MTRSSEEQKTPVEVRQEVLEQKQLVHQQQQQSNQHQKRQYPEDTDQEDSARQQQLQVDNNKPKRNPFCSRCRNHGKSAQVKGHKRHCEFRNCGCEGCRLVECRQLVSAAQIKRRRYQKQDEECGRKIEISPPVLRHESSNDPATIIAKTLMSSASAKHLHSYADASHPRHHHLPEVIGMSNHLQHQHPVLPITHSHLPSEQQNLQSNTNQALAVANTSSGLHLSNRHQHQLIHPPHHHHLHHPLHHSLHHPHHFHGSIAPTSDRQPSTTTATILLDSSSVANSLQQLHSATCNSSSAPSHLKLNHHSPHQTSQASVSNSPVSSALNNAAFHLFHFPTSMLSAAAAASLTNGSTQPSSLASLNPITTTSAVATTTTTTSTTSCSNHSQASLLISPTASTSPPSPSFREQINLVKEVQDTYGPLAIYALLKKEKFDLQKVQGIIELSRAPFDELLQITGHSPLDLTSPIGS